MIVLGIDPGIANVGVGIVQKVPKKYKLIHHSVVTTKASQEHSVRLDHIFNTLSDTIEEYKPKIVVMESLFFAVNARSAMTVGKAMGAISLSASTLKVPIVEYTPLQIKKYLCGYGRAKKPEVQATVMKLLKLKKIPTPQHAADAIAAALTYFEMNAKNTAKTNK
ncbi:crossover junction endodeoxyribonuclease RuvC [Patescibacteria group bacterium]